MFEELKVAERIRRQYVQGKHASIAPNFTLQREFLGAIEKT
jgi:hypothetical protein